MTSKTLEVSQRLNVLLLDGGGVRGLSSLLILQRLMGFINQSVAKHAHYKVDHELQPHDCFELIAGTSTGGLISLMLGKVGMTVEDCIEHYKSLSRKIFSKKQFWGRVTHGLGDSKYSAECLRSCVRDLLSGQNLRHDHPMLCKRGEDRTACAVVCREHNRDSKYSELKQMAVCICSTPCEPRLAANVSDAACATSAAPTFFPVVNIGGRFFRDGGMDHNNPSLAIHTHYGETERINNTRAYSNPDLPLQFDTPGSLTQSAPPGQHTDLDFTRVRYVSIGTGAKSDEQDRRKRDELAKFVPHFIKMGIFMKETLTELVVSSEKHVHVMKMIARASHGDIIYERFSATHEVCWIKLDRYGELDKIEEKTNLYLDERQTQAELKMVAEAIALDYLKKQSAQRPHVSSDPSPSDSHLTPRVPHDSRAPESHPDRANSEITTAGSSTGYQDSGAEHGRITLTSISVDQIKSGETREDLSAATEVPQEEATL